MDQWTAPGPAPAEVAGGGENAGEPGTGGEIGPGASAASSRRIVTVRSATAEPAVTRTEYRYVPAAAGTVILHLAGFAKLTLPVRGETSAEFQRK